VPPEHEVTGSSPVGRASRRLRLRDLAVRTFSYRGDSADNYDGTGTLSGDDLVVDDESFTFVAP
jgi:hypothetical protein